MAWREFHAEVEPMASSRAAQVDMINQRVHLCRS
jgi:hypothetical protein